MPTLAKPELAERESPWVIESDRFFQELWLNRVPILKALGFYDERNLQPGEDESKALVQDEETEIKSIAGALTVAAGASEVLPPAKLIATLKQVAKEPNLLKSGLLPEDVEWAIARVYQRSDEKPGTHWQDIWIRKLAFPKGQAQKPEDSNIARAALAALALHVSRKRGRTPHLANQVLAQELGEIFRRSGKRIARQRLPVMRRGKTVIVEGGPFYDFLRLVLPPLRAYLRNRKLAPVTIDTIVRIATDDYKKAR
jgi:hypothetical protein